MSQRALQRRKAAGSGSVQDHQTDLDKRVIISLASQYQLNRAQQSRPSPTQGHNLDQYFIFFWLNDEYMLYISLRSGLNVQFFFLFFFGK